MAGMSSLPHIWSQPPSPQQPVLANLKHPTNAKESQLLLRECHRRDAILLFVSEEAIVNLLQE